MRGPLVMLLAVALATGAGIATASGLVAQDEPGEAQPPDLLPGPGAVLPGAAAADPARGPLWAVRTYVSQTGLLCAEAGRSYGGVFGDVDEDGTLVPRPEGPTGTCGDPREDPLIAAVRRVPAAGRTVVFGASGRAPSSVRLQVGDAPAVPLAIGERGSFVGVLDGIVDPASLRLTATLGDGTTAHLEFGP